MKYWAYVNNEILGPFEKEKLLELPSFSPSLLVCPQTPVGEKTEDWKEASTYPELSALIASGGASATKPAGAPPAAAAPSSGPAAAPEPAAAPMAFKPLTASSIEPVAPSDHKFGGVEIQANRLGKAPSASPAPAPEAAPVAQNAPGFDPLTLSQVTRKAEEAFPSQPAGSRPPEMETFAPTSAAQAGAARPPEMETFTRAAFQSGPAPDPFAAAPAPAPEAAAPAGAPRADDGALMRKLEAMERNVVSRQDMSAMVDPLRMKLEQMGEVISSMKNQQFQREIMDKLAYLESALGDIKSAMKQGGAPAGAPQQASIAPAQAKEPSPSGRTIFGASSAPAVEEKPKEAAAPAAIVDTGSKGAKFAGLFKKLGRLVVTLALLAAVALGAVIGLKNFGIFDATGFIPFPLPFVQQAAPAPSAEDQAKEQQAMEAIKALQSQAAPEQTAPAQQPKDISPEIVYFTRTYKLAQNGPTLEDKLVELSKTAGGDYSRVDWQVKQGVENIFEIAAVIPSKAGPVAYTFVADYAKKTLLPADAHGTQALEELAGKAPQKITVTKGKAGPARKTQARKAAAPAKKAPAAKKKAAPAEDEYEYEYEDEEAGE